MHDGHERAGDGVGLRGGEFRRRRYGQARRMRASVRGDFLSLTRRRRDEDGDPAGRFHNLIVNDDVVRGAALSIGTEFHRLTDGG